MHIFPTEEYLIQYDLLVNINENRHTVAPEYSDTPTAFFGQLLHILVVRLPPASSLDPQDPSLLAETTYILAAVKRCEIEAQNSMEMPIYRRMGRTEVVDMTCVQCLVGRVPTSAGWAIIDRTGAIQQSVHARDE